MTLYLKDILPPKEEMISALGWAGIPLNGNIMIRKYPEDYLKSDSVSCHYTEVLRMECNKFGLESPAEFYRNNAESIQSRFAGDTLKINDFLYGRVCNHFNPVFTMWILIVTQNGLNGIQGDDIRVLDPFMGWGDRLIGALKSRVVSEYHGYDTNPGLLSAYRSIVADFPESKVSTQFNCIPFENADLPEEYYDLVLTSPPYGPDLEQYPGQPACSGSSLTQRYNDFIKQYQIHILKAFRALKKGGSMVLYVENFSIGGIRFPLRDTTRELLLSLGCWATHDFYLKVVNGRKETLRCAVHYIKR